MIVHLRCFLHVSLRRSSRDDLLLILFSTLIIILMVAGTIVIIANLQAPVSACPTTVRNNRRVRAIAFIGRAGGRTARVGWNAGYRDTLGANVTCNQPNYGSFLYQALLVFLPAGSTGCAVTPTGTFGAAGPVGQVAGRHPKARRVKNDPARCDDLRRGFGDDFLDRNAWCQFYYPELIPR
eukprot:gene24884-26833_t